MNIEFFVLFVANLHPKPYANFYCGEVYMVPVAFNIEVARDTTGKFLNSFNVQLTV